ncbi:hypothetical protein MKK69_26425 [Methylobacterium sp. J-026]|uniref:cupin domain-containing protein n=1 Tax=Methylobacterium sp. J-026 TaxID=2836624 RepID=UPI001FBBD9E5|nr:hypothetical protein [Methylobacterium sp. J-026]MCJ2137537.1 hypothetical protein [Methylobacterium sp. J-026]
MSSDQRAPNSDARPPVGGVACLRFGPPQDPDSVGRAWQDHLAAIFAVSFRPETDVTVPIAMRSYHLGDLLVGDVIAPAHALERSPEMVSQQGLDHILLQFYHRGQSRVETDQGPGAVADVQCVVFDLAQPVRIVAGPVDATNVVIPRAQLERQGCHPDALPGRALDHDGDPFGRRVHNFVANVVACGDLLDRREALAASAAITQLCASWLRGQAGAGPVRRTAPPGGRSGSRPRRGPASLDRESLTGRIPPRPPRQGPGPRTGNPRGAAASIGRPGPVVPTAGHVSTKQTQGVRFHDTLRDLSGAPTAITKN